MAKILRAEGDLGALDELMQKGVIDASAGKIIAVLEKAQPINVRVRVAHEVERGVLKTALHFVAGFVTDIPGDVGIEMLPYVAGEKLAGGEYVRTIPLDSQFFPTSLPPMHRIATYPNGEETYVTVLLFSLHAFQVRLPLKTETPLQYVQPLVDAVAPVLERNDHGRTFSWEDRLTDENIEEYKTNLSQRHDNMMNFMAHRTLRERCRRATDHAKQLLMTMPLHPEEAYRAGLQLEAFDSGEIAILAHYQRVLLA